jgi:hypothetical protein
MRFFTREWLSGKLTDEAFDAVPEAYRRHLASLRLPEHATILAQADLHDAYLLDVSEEPHAARVRLRLRCGDLQRGYADLNIEYSGAAINAVSLTRLLCAAKLPRDEILYDEVDRVGQSFEHRLILVSHAEVCVSFASVALTAHPVSGRSAG